MTEKVYVWVVLSHWRGEDRIEAIFAQQADGRMVLDRYRENPKSAGTEYRYERWEVR